MSKRLSLSPSRKKLREYYGMKRVVVAGGAGFVGMQLVRLLADLVGSKGEVIVLDDFSRGMNIVEAGNVSYAFRAPHTSYVPYELTDWETSRRWVSATRSGCDISRPDRYSYLLDDIDIFFNLTAAVAGVLHNEGNHLQMYHDNISVLTAPLRACEEAGVPAYFQTSSVCVYAEDHQSPCDESAGWGGDPHPANAGYAEAKRDGERAALWSNIPHVVIGRPSNVIGPHDYFDGRAHVIPAFIHRSVTTDGDFQAYGSATAQREFIFSWDVAMGMLYALAFGETRTVYNIGTGGDNMITMLTLATKINHMVGLSMHGVDPERRVIFDNSIGGGDEKRYSNSDRLRELGWKHTVGLNRALDYAICEYLYRGGWIDPDYWRLVYV